MADSFFPPHQHHHHFVLTHPNACSTDIPSVPDTMDLFASPIYDCDSVAADSDSLFNDVLSFGPALKDSKLQGITSYGSLDQLVPTLSHALTADTLDIHNSDTESNRSLSRCSSPVDEVAAILYSTPSRSECGSVRRTSPCKKQRRGNALATAPKLVVQKKAVAGAASHTDSSYPRGSKADQDSQWPDEVLTMSTRDLNIYLKASSHSQEERTLIKQARRRLLNRGYAKKSRDRTRKHDDYQEEDSDDGSEEVQYFHLHPLEEASAAAAAYPPILSAPSPVPVWTHQTHLECPITPPSVCHTTPAVASEQNAVVSFTFSMAEQEDDIFMAQTDIGYSSPAGRQQKTLLRFQSHDPTMGFTL